MEQRSGSASKDNGISGNTVQSVLVHLRALKQAFSDLPLRNIT